MKNDEARPALLDGDAGNPKNKKGDDKNDWYYNR
jgi:hypothetical protein